VSTIVTTPTNNDNSWNGVPRIDNDGAYAPLNVPLDDDGQIIDSFTVEVDNGPTVQEMPVTPGNVIPPTKRPRQTNIGLSGFQLLTATMDPVPILPANADRQDLTVRCISTVATDRIGISDDLGKLQEPAGAPSGLGYQLPAGAAWSPTDATSPVWVTAKNTTGIVYVSWYAPTGQIDEGRG
jgi:hypothetical protein